MQQSQSNLSQIEFCSGHQLSAGERTFIPQDLQYGEAPDLIVEDDIFYCSGQGHIF